MSKYELWKIIAPLSPQERCELRQFLDEMPQLLSSQGSQDPMMGVVELIESLPPMPVPPDFSANFRNHHDHERKSGS